MRELDQDVSEKICRTARGVWASRIGSIDLP